MPKPSYDEKKSYTVKLRQVVQAAAHCIADVSRVAEIEGEITKTIDQALSV